MDSKVLGAGAGVDDEENDEEDDVEAGRGPSRRTRMDLAGRPAVVSSTWQVMGSLLGADIVYMTESYAEMS